MKTTSCIQLLALLSAWFLPGCSPSEDDIRALVRDELQKAAAKSIISEGSPIGPYSPAVKVGNFIFVSGQIGIDPETQALAGGEIMSQTRQALENLNAVLKKAGYDSSHVIQCTVFLKDVNDFQSMNLIYGGFFPEDSYPARTTVEVSNLPRNALVEIAAIAHKN
ncbi:MAG TPA: Rid family detoxifying hydrolase [Bacteroidota bacterium]